MTGLSSCYPFLDSEQSKQQQPSVIRAADRTGRRRRSRSSQGDRAHRHSARQRVDEPRPVLLQRGNLPRRSQKRSNRVRKVRPPTRTEDRTPCPTHRGLLAHDVGARHVRLVSRGLVEAGGRSASVGRCSSLRSVDSGCATFPRGNAYRAESVGASSGDCGAVRTGW